MKNTVKILALSIIVSILTACISGCSLFVDKDKDAEGITKSTLTIYDEGVSTQIVAKYGEKVSIPKAIRAGYYLEGYFDKEEGGKKYFDAEGQSVNNWSKEYPSVFYARWADISSLTISFDVFGNEPKHGGSSGQRTAEVSLDKAFVSAIFGNTDRNLKIEYSIDLKTGNGYEPSPIGMYVKGYDNSGAERYTVFTHTPTVGEFSTFNGSVEIHAADFVDGNIYIVIWNTKAYAGSWAYPVYYSRNLTIKVSIV